MRQSMDKTSIILSGKDNLVSEGSILIRDYECILEEKKLQIIPVLVII